MLPPHTGQLFKIPYLHLCFEDELFVCIRPEEVNHDSDQERSVAFGLPKSFLLLRYRRDANEKAAEFVVTCFAHHMAAPLWIPFKSIAYL